VAGQHTAGAGQQQLAAATAHSNCSSIIIISSSSLIVSCVDGGGWCRPYNTQLDGDTEQSRSAAQATVGAAKGIGQQQQTAASAAAPTAARAAGAAVAAAAATATWRVAATAAAAAAVAARAAGGWTQLRARMFFMDGRSVGFAPNANAARPSSAWGVYFIVYEV
jgi:hypothetical protein